jgi:formylglycine-generating enzyme required for sulfatase activity
MPTDLSYAQLSQLTEDDRADYCRTICELVNGEFAIANTGSESDPLPTFVQSATGLLFKLIPSGEFTMGLTDEQERFARAIFDPPPISLTQLRPTRRRSVRSFLMTKTPVLAAACKATFAGIAPRLTGRDSFPAYIPKAAADQMAASVGCRLPMEVEWEYACRGHTETLFVWGNELPERPELERWLGIDFSRIEGLRHNKFGLCGLFAGEWCGDNFRVSHDDNAQNEFGAYVIKGGGSFFWPWQDQEWVWCIPSMRMASTGLVNGKCSCRFVREL